MDIDVAGEYLRAVEQDADGFALNGPVFFRLTDFPMMVSICLDQGSKYPEVQTEEEDTNTFNEMCEALVAGFEEGLNVTLVPGELSPEERERVSDLRETKYGTDAWSLRGGRQPTKSLAISS